MNRVVVVGNSGSGKSTLSRRLAALVGTEVTELDSIFHQPGWTEIDPDRFSDIVTDITGRSKWVIDGNYRAVAPIIWSRADTVIWFDLPRAVVLSRIIRRTATRVIRGDELWNGNREHWRNLLTWDPERNIIAWSYTQHGAYRTRYLAMARDPRYSHLVTYRLTHRRDGAGLLDALGAGATYTQALMSDANRTESGFPTHAWGSSSGPIAQLGLRIAATRPGAWTIRQLVPIDRAILVRSQGRYTALGPFGTPLLLLTTTGAKSGLARTTPLVYLPDGEAILVAGSNFGQAHHPAWSTNLLANPAATVTIGGVTYDAVATLLDGQPRETAWDAFEAAARPYRSYVARTDRTIRVFRLERHAKGS